MHFNRRLLFPSALTLLLLAAAAVTTVTGYKMYEMKRKHQALLLSLEVERLQQRKSLEDQFEQSRYLASGASVYDRIYNQPQESIERLIEKLAKEAFPASWRIDVRVEEFTKFILLAQAEKQNEIPDIWETIQYLRPILPTVRQYLTSVAIFDNRRVCQWFIDEKALGLVQTATDKSHLPIADFKHKGASFRAFNSTAVSFEKTQGHMVVTVAISGPEGMDEMPMLIDTGASMTTISVDLARRTGNEQLETVKRQTFSTANGTIICPIVTRTIRVGNLAETQEVAVNPKADIGLLGVNFFQHMDYFVDNSEHSIYIWNK